MAFPIHITFRNMQPSAAVEEKIRKEAARLQTFYDRIIDCHVVVEVPHRHRQQGNLFHIRIDLSVPGGVLTVRHLPGPRRLIRQLEATKGVKSLEVQTPHKDLYVALRAAFVAARRRLQDYARRQRHDVKTHLPAPHARVTKLFPVEGYGFLETPDGQEIYFHRNSVVQNGFDQLKIGTVVSFVEAEGEHGLQASTVKICS